MVVYSAPSEAGLACGVFDLRPDRHAVGVVAEPRRRAEEEVLELAEH
jgi:hypothetical protein